MARRSGTAASSARTASSSCRSSARPSRTAQSPPSRPSITPSRDAAAVPIALAVAVDVAAPAAERPHSLALGRLAAVPARLTLGAIVGLSFAVRLVAGLAHATPLYFPDEYIYGSLARSLATSGRLAIRGAPAHFPALLEPLLAAPFWLTGNPELAYRLTQGLNALAMSLAAVPVYLLARRLRLGQGFALACAALAVALPDLLYASFVLADPIAYPLVLGAVYAGICALEAPSRRSHVAFVALAGLAT